MRYGEVLQKAFATAWKYKYLWLLGFFADITTFFSFTNRGKDRIGPEFWMRLSDPESAWLGLGLSLFAMLVILAIVLVFVILERIAEGGLVANAARIERGEQHNLSTAWDAGMKYFPRMLGAAILLLVLIFTFIITLVVIGIVAALIGTPLLVLSLILLIPLLFCGLFVLAITFAYAERFIVLEDQRLFAALESGFRLFKTRLGESIAIGIIALLVVIGIIIVLAIAFITLILPIAMLSIVSKPLAVFFGIFIVLPLAVLVTSYLGAYRSCLWTFFFMKLRPGTAAVAPVSGGDSGPDALRPPEPPQFE